MKKRKPSYSRLLSDVLTRAIVFTFLWWILTQGHPEAFSYGMHVVIITALVSMAIRPIRGRRWRLKGFVRFLPFFLWQSLQGGVDVARRIYDPRLPISPSLLTYSMQLQDETARIFFAGTISLLPGTLSTELEGTHLQVHVLDDSQPTLRKLRSVENRVASLYGTDLMVGNEITPGGKP